jgi:hypothetical protein
VVGAAGVHVIPDDLAGIVDAIGRGAKGARGIVDGGVGTAAENEAVVAAVVAVGPDDLAHGVDAKCSGAYGGQGIIEGGVGVDWHDTASSGIVSLAERADR